MFVELIQKFRKYIIICGVSVVSAVVLYPLFPLLGVQDTIRLEEDEASTRTGDICRIPVQLGVSAGE